MDCPSSRASSKAKGGGLRPSFVDSIRLCELMCLRGAEVCPSLIEFLHSKTDRLPVRTPMCWGYEWSGVCKSSNTHQLSYSIGRVGGGISFTLNYWVSLVPPWEEKRYSLTQECGGYTSGYYVARRLTHPPAHSK